MPDAAGTGSKRAFLLLSLAVLTADQWSKWWVEANLALGRPMEIIPGFLNFTHVENPGVAFGLFAGHDGTLGTILLIGLGVAALAIVGYYYFRIEADQKLVIAALALVLGGAVGNLTDRLLSGSVTDFIDAYLGTYHWHTFNVADSAITIGVLLILFDSFRPRSSDEKTASNDAESESEPAGDASIEISRAS
ncbi:MAG: signal peptidase II [Thermoanaerobaculia bacterium]